MDKENFLNSLKVAIDEESAEKLESIMMSLHEFEDDKEFVPYLSELLEANWHFVHEDISLTLQRIGDNRATKSLLKTAKRKFDYLDYDDSYPLARKCTWALADIGSEESKKALLELSELQDEEIARYAKKRLDNWEREKNRKKSR